MASESPFPSFLPGLDFLKGLAGQAGKGLAGLQGAGMQGAGAFQQWVAPVLDPDELDKRIEELRTVQFWLEQNAKLLGATIQALEVQKMTLTTLRSLNVPVPDLKAAFETMKGAAGLGAAGKSPSAAAPSDAPQRAASGSGSTPPATEPSKPTKPSRSPKSSSSATSSSPKGATATPTDAGAATADALRWWGALTDQFAQIANQALSQVDAARKAADRPTGPAAGDAASAGAGAAAPRKGGAGRGAGTQSGRGASRGTGGARPATAASKARKSGG